MYEILGVASQDMERYKRISDYRDHIKNIADVKTFFKDSKRLKVNNHQFMANFCPVKAMVFPVVMYGYES